MIAWHREGVSASERLGAAADLRDDPRGRSVRDPETGDVIQVVDLVALGSAAARGAEVVEQLHLVRADRADAVLVEERWRLAILHGELVVRSAQTPQHVSRAGVDRRHLVQVAEGEQEIAPRVEIERVGVRPVHHGGVAVGRVEDAQLHGEVIERAPVEQDGARCAQVLHAAAEHARAGGASLRGEVEGAYLVADQPVRAVGPRDHVVHAR
jgi:hypothetical protein